MHCTMGRAISDMRPSIWTCGWHTDMLEHHCCAAGRQRKDNGNPTLYAQIARQFDVPAAEASNGQSQAALFQHWIYLTQARSTHVLPSPC